MSEASKESTTGEVARLESDAKHDVPHLKLHLFPKYLSQRNGHKNQAVAAAALGAGRALREALGRRAGRQASRQAGEMRAEQPRGQLFKSAALGSCRLCRPLAAASEAA